MGYLTQVTGEIQITPPLTWKEIQEKGYQLGFPEECWTSVQVHIHEEEQNTDEGVLTRRTGITLIPACSEPYKAHSLVQHVQKIIDTFPGHEFTGYLECDGDETGDLWRLYVKHREAYKVLPTIIWEEDARATTE